MDLLKLDSAGHLLDEQDRICIREIGDSGYYLYDYPREAAESLAERARELFAQHFQRCQHSIGISLPGLTAVGRHAHIKDRGTPALNFTHLDGVGGSCAMVAENQDGDLAIELQTYRKDTQPGDDSSDGWSIELRAPDWQLLSLTK